MGTTLPIEAITTGFDYSRLAPDIRAEVETATRRLHDLERRTSESVVEIGQILIQQRTRTQGHFLDWLKQSVGWSERTAYNFIAVAEKFANVANFASIAPSALYALASPSTPEEVRIEFTELAKIGRAVRHKDVKEAVANTKTRTKAEPIPVLPSLSVAHATDRPTTVTRNGSTYEMNTETIGRRPVALIDDDVDQGTGEIVAERRRRAPTPAEERARMVAIGIVRANGNTFSRNVANAILEITGA